MSWEVWTMKSKTSFFDLTLLKKNISRFAPGWGILLVMLFLVFPLSALRDVYYGDGEYYLNDIANAGTLISAFSAIFFAAPIFRYLHNPRSAYMMHAFPMTRTCLFLTNLISGLLFFLVPALVIFLANLCVFGLHSLDGGISMHLFWLIKWTMEYLFFYGLAVFCMFLSGSQFISILSYVALNIVFVAIPWVFLQVFDAFVFGFDSSAPSWLMYLCPLAAMLEKGQYLDLLPLAVYACIGLGLMVLSWWFYQKRHVERAGDAMVFPWAQHLFRLIFTFCVGLYFGMAFATAHEDYFLPLSIIGLFMGWFGSTMMLERTVKVFKLKKVWLGYGIFVAILVVSVTAMRYDVLSFQTRIPETEQIESVDVWTYDYEYSVGLRGSDKITLTEQDQIELVRQVHRECLRYRENEVGDIRLFGHDNYGIHIEYKLKNGSTLRRSYPRFDEIGDEFWKLYSDGRVAGPWYEDLLKDGVYSGTLESFSSYGEYGYPYSYNCRNGEALRAAVVADAKAGQLPVDTRNWYLFDNNYSDSHYELTLRCKGGDMIIRLPETATETLALFEPKRLAELNDWDISLDAERSQLIDSEIHGDQVYLTYKLTFNNGSGSYRYGRLSARFPEDAGTTLREDESLPGYLVSDLSDRDEEYPTDRTPVSIVSLEPGQTELEVMFTGRCVGDTQQKDFPLPELRLYHIDGYDDEDIIIPIQ